MKPLFFRVINIPVFLTCCFLLLSFQYSKGIAVAGSISVQQGAVEGAVVHSIMDGHRLDIHKVDNRGKYKLELACNHKYELIFAQEGNFSQKIVVETLVPDKVLQSNPQFEPIALDVNLFTEIDGINLSLVEKPTRKIYFNPMLNNFISDVYINDTQITKQIEKAVWQSQIIKKEIGFLSKLNRFELAEMKREYDKIIEKAGKVYDEGPVLAALNDNFVSNNFFINDNFNYSKNEEINELLGAMIIAAELDKVQRDKYDDFIFEADNLLSQKKYTSARINYNRALSINPDDYYAKSQTDLIDGLLEEQLEAEQYKYLVAQADNSFDELLYSEAANDYRKAILVKPDEDYAKMKLEKVNSILEKEYKNAEKSTTYKQTMKEAEVMYQKQFYEKSLASYAYALNLEPGDNQATRKMVNIKNEMNKLADKLMYDRLIASADKMYKKEVYPEAKKEYYAATEIFPDNNYAIIRINAINQKLELKEKFEDFISNANHLYAAKEFSESKENYLQALKINANDEFIKSRIKEINETLEIQNTEEKYNSSLADADEMFNTSDYYNAKIKYKEASKIKPKEKYPKEKLDEIDNLLIQNSKTIQQYRQAIAKADGLFNRNLYEEAKLVYAEAGIIKPEETYPSEMAGKIENILSEQNGLAYTTEVGQFPVNEVAVISNVKQQSTLKTENEIEYSEANKKTDNLFNNELEVSEVENEVELKNIYTQYINQADELFDAQKYIESRRLYYKALDTKPDENHSKQQIENINQLLKETPLSQIDKEYLQFVDLADSTFNENQYAVARGWYNRALAIKSNEQYPKYQLNEIEKKITERMAAQSGEQFETDVQKASVAYEAKNYNVARFWYKKALELRPEDKEVKNRLLEIENATKYLIMNE